MSWLKKIFGHSHRWEKRELNPHKEKDYGYQKVCKDCNKIGEKVRPDEYEDKETRLPFEL